jgi:hypothetical protein
MKRDLTVVDPFDHTRELSVVVDVSDYPRFLIESVTTSDDEEVVLTPELEYELYVVLSVCMAADQEFDL